MNGIQQIYCTHCTYGSSALDHREGEFADRTLGYSARASSLDHADLRKYYRAIERFLSYYLPTDTPTEEKLRLTASNAPKRLVYHPDYNGMQLLAQVSYRQKDTAGRPGSYFGHVLLSDRANGRWDVLDCLKLWGAGWVSQDSPDLPLEIPALGDLKELRRGAKAAITDQLLLTFLTAEAGEDFIDPAGIVPARWRDKSALERRGLLVDVLQHFLEDSCSRKESVLLVIEPEVAAILFYGVARLLPPGPLREQLSFSTFEPSVDRLSVLLAATTFHSPQTSDLRPEAYRGRGWVCNTFSNRTSDRPASTGVFGRVIVERLCADGWSGVDAFLGDVVNAGAAAPTDLEGLARVQRLAPALLDVNAELPKFEGSPVASAYLGKSTRDLLARERPGSVKLVALCNSPRLLTLLDLVARDAKNPAAKPVIDFLLTQLPEASFAGFLALRHVDLASKAEALGHFLRCSRRFPTNCDALWEAAPSKLEPAPNSPEMALSETLATIPGDLLELVVKSVPLTDREALWLALARGSTRHPHNSTLLQTLGEIVAGTSDEILCGYLRRNGREMIAGGYPREEMALRQKLAQWYAGLANSGAHFSQRLDILRAWIEYAPNVTELESRLPKWIKLRELLLSLKAENAPQTKTGGSFFQKSPQTDTHAIGQRIAELVRTSLMPDQTYSSMAVLRDSLETASEKWRRLRAIGAGLLNDNDFLPEETQQAILWYFEGNMWNNTIAKKKKSSGLCSVKWSTPLLVSLVVGASLGVASIIIFTGPSGETDPKSTIAGAAGPTAANPLAKNNNSPHTQSPDEKQEKIVPTPNQEKPQRPAATKPAAAADSEPSKKEESKKTEDSANNQAGGTPQAGKPAAVHDVEPSPADPKHPAAVPAKANEAGAPVQASQGDEPAKPDPTKSPAPQQQHSDGDSPKPKPKDENINIALVTDDKPKLKEKPQRALSEEEKRKVSPLEVSHFSKLPDPATRERTLICLLSGKVHGLKLRIMESPIKDTDTPADSLRCEPEGNDPVKLQVFYRDQNKLDILVGKIDGSGSGSQNSVQFTWLPNSDRVSGDSLNLFKLSVLEIETDHSFEYCGLREQIRIAQALPFEDEKAVIPRKDLAFIPKCMIETPPKWHLSNVTVRWDHHGESKHFTLNEREKLKNQYSSEESIPVPSDAAKKSANEKLDLYFTYRKTEQDFMFALKKHTKLTDARKALGQYAPETKSKTSEKPKTKKENAPFLFEAGKIKLLSEFIGLSPPKDPGPLPNPEITDSDAVKKHEDKRKHYEEEVVKKIITPAKELLNWLELSNAKDLTATLSLYVDGIRYDILVIERREAAKPLEKGKSI